MTQGIHTYPDIKMLKYNLRDAYLRYACPIRNVYTYLSVCTYI